MRRLTSFFILLLSTQFSVSAGAQECAEPSVQGWATIGLGTTGGVGGPSVLVTNMAQFNSYARKQGKLIIYVKGILKGTAQINSENKTIYGYKGATIQGTLKIVSGARNVIVRNLIIRGNACTVNAPDECGPSDGVSIEGPAQGLTPAPPSNIWLDHLDIADGQDGNCDISHGPQYITISWCKFWYTKTKPHSFSNLIGHDDGNASQDNARLTVTMHHCWWADNVVERQPRIRYGRVHLVNNLHTSQKSKQMIQLGINADVLAEGNIVKATGNYEADYAPNGASFAAFEGRNNLGEPDQKLGGMVFTPPYTLNVDAPADAEVQVRACAGATLADPSPNIALNDFIVAPNPFVGELKLYFPEDFEFTLTDIMGRVVAKDSQSQTLETTALAPGLYLLTIVKGGETITYKIQKAGD